MDNDSWNSEETSATASLSKWLAITIVSVLLIGGGGAVLNGCVITPLRTGEVVKRAVTGYEGIEHFFAIEREVHETRFSRESEPFTYWSRVGLSAVLSLILLWPGIANLIGGFMRSPGLAIGYLPDDRPGPRDGKCSCPHCENSIAFDFNYSGTEIECPHCQGRLLLPESDVVEHSGRTKSAEHPLILLVPAVALLSFLFAWIFQSIDYWIMGLAAIVVGVLFEINYRLQRRRGRFIPGKIVGHEKVRRGGDGDSWHSVIEYSNGDRTDTFLSAVGFGISVFGLFSIKPPLPRIGKRVDVLMVDGEPTSERLKLPFRVFVVTFFCIVGVTIIAQHKMGEAIAQSKSEERSAQSATTTSFSQIETREWTEQNLPLLLAASDENPEDTIAAMTLAALQLWFDQDAAFEATRKRMLGWAAGTQKPQVAERVAKLYSLRPYTVAEHQTNVVSLSNTALFGTGGRPDRWTHMAYGMVVYRLGDFDVADDYLLTAVNAIPAGQSQPLVEGVCGYYRAMILFQRGRHGEAKALYRATYSSMKPLPSDPRNPLAGGATHDDLILWLACREAKSLLGE